MKMNYWVVVLAIMSSFVLHADDTITQIVYAEEQYNPYADEHEQQNKKIIYYLKDKKLYMDDITDLSNKTTHEMPIYQFKDKENQKKWEQSDLYFDFGIVDKPGDRHYKQDWYEDDFESIHINIMHIGQPVDIVINKKARWAMPLVTKEQWILGNLFRTDLCVLEQRKVKEGTNADDFQVVEPKEGEAPVAQEKTIYLLRKIGVGHRAPTKFVGFWNVQNIQELSGKQGWAILSSSTWPTLKWRFLKTDLAGKELKNDEYILDSQNGENSFILIAKQHTQTIRSSRWTKKTKVWIEKLTFYTKNNEQDNRISKSTEEKFPPVLFCPSTAIDSAFFLDQSLEEAIDSIISNLALALEKIQKLENMGQISKQVKIYLRPKNETLIIPENGFYSQIFVLNSGSKYFLQKGEEKYIITSSAFDFKDNNLFLGIYNGATKKSFIKIVNANKKSHFPWKK